MLCFYNNCYKFISHCILTFYNNCYKIEPKKNSENRSKKFYGTDLERVKKLSLKEARNRAGFTLSELGKLTGINPSVLGFYECQKRNINGAKLSTLLAICEALSCRLEDILTDEFLVSQIEDYMERVGEKENEEWQLDE